MPVIGTKGANLDILIRQGATFGPVTARLKDNSGNVVDITGYTFRSQIRKTPTSTLVEGATAVFNVVDYTGGVFTFEFTADVTALLTADAESETAPASIYVWDMEMQDTAGRVIPLVYGKVNVFREVTKSVP